MAVGGGVRVWVSVVCGAGVWGVVCGGVAGVVGGVGCGGTCGDECTGTDQCYNPAIGCEPCQPDCAGKICGPAGCGAPHARGAGAWRAAPLSVCA